MRILPLILMFVCLGATPALAQDSGSDRPIQVAQSNGKSLSEAVEQVRRQTNGRIVSAETKVKNGREVHHIKVLTEDGKVKTHKVQGRKRGNG
ncbi:MAG: PepSY domain-containing protein [Woeseiaceae bacterium]